ncbi:glycoside hydrolase [Micromonospora sp. KC723]|uniref:glycoside hydrolase n=1 Tax=Micromonospora sp. KC723 TaxID=2530381 RepID=UPI001A9F6A6D|nr:glycoside hydrolase [Micromonospora sp. KC723]
MSQLRAGRRHRHRTADSQVRRVPPRVAVAAAATALAAGVAVAVVTAPAAAAAVAQVSSAPAQTIQNIGASGAWWVNDLARFSTANQQRVAELLFGASGIQLSAYRFNIGGGGVGVQAGDRAPQTFQVSPGRYDWSRDPGGTTFLRHAAQYGVPDIVGFVNSAPAVWTSNGRTCGGRLKAGSEQAYANYLADIVTHFNAEGVRINYVSPMNEPAVSFSQCTQEGMLVAADQRDDVVRAVGQTLASRAPFARISADETDKLPRFLSEVPQWIGQPGTAQYVANLAHHTYDFPGDSTLAQVPAMAGRYGKPTWATEICCWNSSSGNTYGAQYDPTITGALPMASIIHRDLTIANDSAFHWWTALSKVMGCSPGGNPSCATTINSTGYNDGLIYFDPNYASNGNQNLYLTKRFHTLGQYSKFVRPGSVRYPVAGAPSGVQIMATLLNGNWTLVVNNLTTTTQSVDVRLPVGSLTASSAYRTSATENLAAIGLPAVSGGTASLDLPAQSVTTYVLRADGASPAPTTPAPSGHVKLVNRNSGKVIGVSGASTADGAPIVQQSDTGAASQQWQVVDAGGGYVKLVNRNSGKVLDVDARSTADGATVIQYSDNGGANQHWQRVSSGDYVKLVNRHSGKVLDVYQRSTADGAAVVQWSDNGGSNQQWSLPAP